MTAPRIRVEHVGHEREPVVVIDGFAPDPARLIAEACAAPLAALGAYYPGVRAPVDRAYLAEVGPVLAAAARQVFGFTHRLAFDRALFSLTVTPPAALTLAQRLPHIDDVAPGKLAVVHYLGEQDWGGTRFFRQRRTGFETVGPDRHRAYLDALATDLRQHGEPVPGYIDGPTPLFAPIAQVTARPNRAVLYRSNLLHCAAIDNAVALPADPATGRLTVASFLTAA
ncbi:DUF6445 family protein [Sphingomonas sp. KR1UV-12]|uniref:DUF6445 family protein n=1 Tax=Sphingomonas aurea TaxID=3063994 RepID=A0ABT9EIP1_9SPHN|nr:DUF6445 family protein [Sphingomonas sp. KR1UV-12]MDP1026707.1 DUF6445 family protein [Sphingomonas sp. KR1UV-12]